MKIKHYFCLVAMLCALQCFGGPLTFEVEAPTWKQLVKAKDYDGVNIRKLPSATAPKLVYNENKVEDYDVPAQYYGYWSAKGTGGPIVAIKFNGPDVLLSQQNGWYEVKNIGPKFESNGWVSAKYCEALAVTPMQSPRNPAPEYFAWLGDKGDGGTYAMYVSSNEMEGEVKFYYGRLKDGFVVCPYVYTCNWEIDSNAKSVSIVKNQYNSYTLVSPGYEIDMQMVGRDIIDFVIAKAAKVDAEYVICNFDGSLIVMEK